MSFADPTTAATYLLWWWKVDATLSYLTEPSFADEPTFRITIGYTAGHAYSTGGWAWGPISDL